jgi:hypothetical protein
LASAPRKLVRPWPTLRHCPSRDVIQEYYPIYLNLTTAIRYLPILSDVAVAARSRHAGDLPLGFDLDPEADTGPSPCLGLTRRSAPHCAPAMHLAVRQSAAMVRGGRGCPSRSIYRVILEDITRAGVDEATDPERMLAEPDTLLPFHADVRSHRVNLGTPVILNSRALLSQT